MPRKRSTYTAEFKPQAARMITDQKLAVAEVARRLDVGENLLRTRKEAFEERGRCRLPGARRPDPGRRRTPPPEGRERPSQGRTGSPKKSRRVLRQPAELTFRFVADSAGEWPVARMCEALEVSASGYYAWASRPNSATGQWRQEPVGAIEGVHAEVRHRYGSPRMTAELRARGYECCENTVARLMNASGITARTPRRFVRTTDSAHPLPVAANLLDRDFDPDRPNQVWCADITHIPTGEGWLYLAVVEDLFSRMVVGRSMAEAMESRLVVDALEMAVARRLPLKGSSSPGLLAHSDRGSRCASDRYQRVRASEGITCSMSGAGQCWEYAPVESFFGRLRCEIEPDGMFATRDQARAVIFEYLEVFDNRVRRRSSPGLVSPAEFGRTHNQTHR